MDCNSYAERLPAPLHILFLEFDYTGEVEDDKMYMPDSSTFKIDYPTVVTWFFSGMESFTARPIVTKIPRVDFLGRTDRASKRVIYDAFYNFGLQLKPGDLEYMKAQNWSLTRFVDHLIQLETDGAETVFTRVFEKKEAVKAQGFMWLPFLNTDKYGVSAKLGFHKRVSFLEPLPLYQGPQVDPPAYSENDVTVIRELPPLYEDVVPRTSACLRERPASKTKTVQDSLPVLAGLIAKPIITTTTERWFRGLHALLPRGQGRLLQCIVS
ncbi:hypothetical protein F5Y16DRAFT_423798 [Xylariaceae sp. FL0255]|nr:hypothetical protein F5Y16DRAFT_423798 [Xylariaceae sp. FL0255]